MSIKKTIKKFFKPKKKVKLTPRKIIINRRSLKEMEKKKKESTKPPKPNRLKKLRKRYT